MQTLTASLRLYGPARRKGPGLGSRRPVQPIVRFVLGRSLLLGGADESQRARDRAMAAAALRGVYECAIGNFGMPQYGGTMHGVVVYPKANTKACKPFADFGLSFNPKAGGLPVFLLVDRGGFFSSPSSFHFHFHFHRCLFP